MKLVIDIPESALELLNTTGVDWLDAEHILSAVAHGMPLDTVKAEIEKKIEQERFARSVFRGEEKDTVKAEQCTGSIFAYENMIRFIENIGKAESEE